MHMSSPQPKLNAKMGLIVTSILSFVNAGVGTLIAVKENLPSVTPVSTTGKPALKDFLTGNGTADDSFRRTGDCPAKTDPSSRSQMMAFPPTKRC